jgi:hypothetical protein
MFVEWTNGAALEQRLSHQARRSRKRRVATQFEDLQSCYLQLRRCRRAAAGASAAGSDAGAPGASPVCSGGEGGGGGGEGGGAVAVTAAAAAGASSPARPGAEDAAQPAAAAGAPGAAGGAGTVGAVLASGGLAEFSRMLSVFTHCSKLRVRPAAATRSQGGSFAQLRVQGASARS